MIKCRINLNLICGYQVKMGKGLWNYLSSCVTCPVFQKVHQKTLLGYTENYKLACPHCEVPNPFYQTPTDTYKCKYCGTFFKISEVLEKREELKILKCR